MFPTSSRLDRAVKARRDAAPPRDALARADAPRPLSATDAPVVPLARARATTLRRLLLALGLVLGFIDAVASRNAMNPDGISYLDMGDAFWRGDWHAALNGLWSPLYGVLLGGVLRVVRPGLFWEFPVVHAVNFAIYAAALFCFDAFLRRLVARSEREARHPGADGLAPLPRWAWFAIGYPVFISASLVATGVAVVAPDLLAAALVYSAGALLVRPDGPKPDTWRLPALGVVLAVGYLSRALILPLAVVLLAALWAASREPGTRRAALLGIAVFVAVTAPFVVALSVQEGHLTAGDTAVLNYAYHVDGVPYVHWRGGPPGCGVPEHPVHRIAGAPAVYEFAAPFRTTYPLWYAPAYWYDGIEPCFVPGRLATAIAINLTRLAHIVLVNNGAATLVMLTLSWWTVVSGSAQRFIQSLARVWGILLLACLGLAGLICVYIEPRFVALFMVLLWVGVLSTVRLPPGGRTAAGVRAVAGAFVTVALIMLLSRGIESLRSIDAPAQAGPAQVAAGLRAMGVQTGDAVAVIGTAFPEYWARLAGVRVVAEVPDEAVRAFWTASPGAQRRTLRALVSAGVRAVVTEDVPPGRVPAGWRRVGATPYYVRLSRRD